jgi:hypothetical protein
MAVASPFRSWPRGCRTGNEQYVQQFVNQLTWDPVPVQRRLVERMLPLIEPTAWVIDDVSVPKDGGCRWQWPRSTEGLGQASQLTGRGQFPRFHAQPLASFLQKKGGD